MQEAPGAGQDVQVQFDGFDFPCRVTRRRLRICRNSIVNSEQPVTASHGLNDGGKMRVLCALLVVAVCAGCASYDDRVVTDRYGDKWEKCAVKGGRPAWCRLE
jgi:hypothetical protein